MEAPPARPQVRLYAVLGLFLLLGAVQVVGTVHAVHLPGYSDFGSYYLYARMGRHHGWSSLYDLNVQAQEWRALGGAAVVPWFPMVYPPPLAWVAAPFTVLPLSAAYLAWIALLALLLLLCWRTLMPAGPRLARLAALPAMLALLPVTFALVLGQILVVVLAAVVGAWWLLERRRDALAGVLLCAMVFKPQVAFMVPVVLLLGGRPRAMAAWLGGMVLIAAAALASIGSVGWQAYESRLAGAAAASPAFIVPTEFTLAGLVGTGFGLRVAQGLVLLLVLAAAYANRRRGASLLVAIGLIGSMLLTPYLHLQDLSTLVVAGGLALRGPLTLWQRRMLAGGYLLLLAISILESRGLGLLLGPMLLLLEMAWLAATLAAAGRPRLSQPARPPAPATAA